jgi:hypothetical protein
MRKLLMMGAALVAASFGFAQNQGALTKVQPGLQNVVSKMADGGAKYLENRGQWDSRALYRLQKQGLTYWVTATGAVMDFHTTSPVPDSTDRYRVGQVVTMELVGATPSRIEREPAGPAKFKTDFIGFSGKRSAKGVASFAETTIRNIGQGMNMRHYVDNSQPRYDVVIRPSAVAKSVDLVFKGANRVWVDKDGSIQIDTIAGQVSQRGLQVYQMIDGKKSILPSKFVDKGNGRIGVNFSKAKAGSEIIVDPVVYGTYVGGDSGDDSVNAVVADNNQNVYATGFTVSDDFPINIGPYGVNLKETQDSYVMGLTGDAYDVTYSAYIGGVGSDGATALQIDQFGNLWLAGETTSAVLPRGLKQDLRATTYRKTGLYDNPIPSGKPVYGNFTLTYRGQETALLPHNATATNVADALNALSNAPAGGFTVVGPALPDGNLTIRATDPETFPLGINQPTVSYIVTLDNTGAQTISWPDSDPPGTQLGFKPKSGHFVLQYVRADGTVSQPALLPFDADGEAFKTALNAAPISLPGPDVAATGGGLPDTPVIVTFANNSATNFPMRISTPFNLTTGGQTFVTGLNGGAYELANAPSHPFFMRFEPSATDKLDPFTNELVYSVGGEDGPLATMTGFAIKPVTTPTGTVEIALAGNTTTQIDELAADLPASGNTGYLLRFSYNNASRTLTQNTNASWYVGGSLRTEIAGIAMDATGSTYCVGTVYSTSNVLTNSNSTTFKTTSGLYANGNLIRKNDAFIRKYDANGNVAFCGVLGGSGDDYGRAITVDRFGSAYISCSAFSFNFPRTTGAFGQIFSASEALTVTKLSPTANALVYSTNLGTSGPVRTHKMAVDTRGNVYLVGTVGYTIPLTGNTIPAKILTTPVAPAIPDQVAATDAIYQWGDQAIGTSTSEGFITVVNATASGLLYSTYVGETCNDDVVSVYVDASNNCFVGGFTTAFASVIPVQGYATTVAGSPSITGPFALPGAFITPLAFKAVPDILFDGFLLKLRVALPILKDFFVSPQDIAGGLGATSTGVVDLQNPAPASGTQVTIRVLHPNVARLSTNGATTVRITIPAGQTRGTFPIYSRPVTQVAYCDVRAELDGDFLADRLNVFPWMNDMTIDTDEIPGGNSLTGTILLTSPAPTGGLQAVLTTDTAGKISFPSSVITIPEGQQSAQFQINTEGVNSVTNTTITATVQGVGISRTLKLLPPSVKSITFNPAVVNGGESSTCTIDIDGKASVNTIISLTKSGLPLTIPASVTVPSGQRSVSFAVGTAGNSGSTGLGRVIATLNGSSVTGDLTIEGNDILSIVLSSNSVVGGSVVTGTVNLVRPATQTGFTITLGNSNPAIGTLTPTQLTIPPGASSGAFTIQTLGISTTQNMIVSASKSGYTTRSQTLEVRALSLDLTFTPSITPGGSTTIGKVSLLNGEVAPAGGVIVNLQSSNAGVLSVPSSVIIPEGATNVQFLGTASIIATDSTVTVTATVVGGAAKSTNVTVVGANLKTFTVTPSTLSGGTPITGTITLAAPAPTGGASITVTSTNNALVTPPTPVIVPAGQSTVTFTIQTATVSSNQTVVLTATRAGVTKTANVNLTVSQIGVSSVTFSPSSVLGGANSTCTVTLDLPAPSGGLTVNLSADKPSFLTNLPSSVTVPAGSRTISFSIGTTQVTREVAVTITATVPSSGKSYSGVLYIQTNVGW